MEGDGVNVEVRKEFEAEGGSSVLARQIKMPVPPRAGEYLSFNKESPDPDRVASVLYDVESGWYYAFVDPVTDYDIEWAELEKQAVRSGWTPVESEYPYQPEE